MMEILLPLLILVLGVTLLLAEDLLPTGGALGILALGCLGILLYLGFSTSTALGVRYLVAEVVLVPMAYLAFAFLMEKTGIKRLVSLRPPDAEEVDHRPEGPEIRHLIGQRGRAITALRPSGMVDFDGRRLDGVAEAGLIPSGASVLAIEVRTGRLVVRIESEGESIETL